jgi:hypothetical protein
MCSLPKILLVAIAAGAAARSAEVHPIDEDLGGPKSSYADVLLEIARRGEIPAPEHGSSSPVGLTCVATPGDGKYVGTIQRMEIAAPLAAVEQILGDVAHYKDLFPGCAGVREVPGSRDGNRYVTAWEQRVPVPLVPNSRYELTYLVSRPSERLLFYRYRLARTGDLTNSDGLIALEAMGPERTRLTGYDFFNARWGILPERLVWRESLRGTFAADLAIKLKAEHPAWSYGRIAAEADRVRSAAKADLDQCLRHRTAASAVFTRGTNPPKNGGKEPE